MSPTRLQAQAAAAPAANPQVLLEVKAVAGPLRPPVSTYVVTNHLFKRYNIKPTAQAWGLFGFLFGITSAAFDFKLGANFADRITDQSIKNDYPAALLVIEGTFSLLASIPVAALIGLPTRDAFIASTQWDGNKRKTSLPRLQIGLEWGTNLLAVFCGVPFAYELIEIYEGQLGMQIFLASSAMLTGYTTGKVGLGDLYLKRFYDYFDAEPLAIRVKRAELALRFEELLAKVQVADQSIIDVLFQFYAWGTDNDGTLDDETFFTAYQNGLNVSQILPAPRPPEPLSLGKKILNLTALALGTAASWTLFALTLQSVSAFDKETDIDDPEGAAALQSTTGAAATLNNCAFLATFDLLTFNDFHHYRMTPGYRPQMETGQAKLRKVSNIGSYLLGAFAAVPNLDLSIQEGTRSLGANVILDAAAFSGVALALGKAIDMLFQDIITLYQCRFDNQSPAFRRDTLMRLFNVAITQIKSHLSPEKVTTLHEAFFRPPTPAPAEEKAVAAQQVKGGSPQPSIFKEAKPNLRVTLDELPEVEMVIYNLKTANALQGAKTSPLISKSFFPQGVVLPPPRPKVKPRGPFYEEKKLDINT